MLDTHAEKLLNCRPLGIIFFTILIVFSYKQLYPKARLQIPHEVQKSFATLTKNFAELRKEKPGAFCLVVSGGLVTLAVAGHYILGVWLVLVTLIAIILLCAKYNVIIVHDNIIDEKSKEELATEDTGEISKDPPWSRANEYEIPDEFLPDVSDEMNISLLQKVAEDADVSSYYLYKDNSNKNADKEDSDSEVPSDLLLTSDKIPEIEDEEMTHPSSGLSPLDSPLDIELPRNDIKVSYDPFSEGIEFRNQRDFNDGSSDSDDSISRGLNFQDVSLPDGSRSGPKDNKQTKDGSSQKSSQIYVPSKMSSSSSQQPEELEPKNNSPNWNIVNNLWDAVNSSVAPLQPTVISAGNVSRLQIQRKSVNAELSSDESDFELLDSEDLNINT
ncbi:uncharacterized protein LOC134833879 isoform X2 [Culicoides brevitarsis]|uniref:uncharacterized protein LOC134833879 isoform X2 n=1 Tax=Culicoides brevitarsis TaxID=469753 RepID=UPI00307C03C4